MYKYKCVCEFTKVGMEENLLTFEYTGLGQEWEL